jgi:hypothetical protein
VPPGPAEGPCVYPTIDLDADPLRAEVANRVLLAVRDGPEGVTFGNDRPEAIQKLSRQSVGVTYRTNPTPSGNHETILHSRGSPQRKQGDLPHSSAA